MFFFFFYPSINKGLSDITYNNITYKLGDSLKYCTSKAWIVYIESKDIIVLSRSKKGQQLIIANVENIEHFFKYDEIITNKFPLKEHELNFLNKKAYLTLKKEAKTTEIADTLTYLYKTDEQMTIKEKIKLLF